MEVSGQLHAPDTSPLGIQPPGNHWIGGWVGPTISLGTVVKRKKKSLPPPGN